MDRKRDLWLDALKGLAIIFIVLGHTIERMETGTGYINDPLHFIDVGVNRIHIHIFFIVSGFLFGLFERKKLFVHGNLKIYVRKKALDLFLPYTYFAIIIWLGKMAFSDFVVRQTNFQDLVFMFIKPVAFMWYIYVLFWISVLVACLLVALKNNMRVIAILGIAMLLVNIFWRPELILLYKIFQNTFIFCLGIIIAENKDILKNKILFSVSGLITVIFVYLSWRFENQSELIYAITNVSSALFFLMLFYKLRNIDFSLLTKLGQETLYIYIMHPVILNAIRMVFIKIGFDCVPIWIIVMLTSGIGLPYVYAIIAKRIKVLEVLFKPRRYIEAKFRNVMN